MEALPGTLLLALQLLLFATIIGVLLGVLAAVKRHLMDTSAVFASIAGISQPHFYGHHHCLFFA